MFDEISLSVQDQNSTPVQNVKKPFEEIRYDLDSFIYEPIEDFVSRYNMDYRAIDAYERLIMDYRLQGFEDVVPYVAGGWLRRWVEGVPFDNLTCDMDLYFTIREYKNGSTPWGSLNAKSPRDNFKDWLVSFYGVSDKTETSGTNYTLNLDHPFDKVVEIQLMGEVFDIGAFDKRSIASNLSLYDSCASMLAYSIETGAICYHKNTIEHIREKRFQFNQECRSISPVLQFRRMMKFWGEGWSFDLYSQKDFLKWVTKNKDRIDNTLKDDYRQ